MLSIDVVKQLVPKQHKDMITEGLVKVLNNAVTDPKAVEAFRENFVSYLNVLKEGKYKLEDYINAVKFVSYKLLNYTDLNAYVATFPDRYDRLVKEGVKDISPYASMYKKNKLVIQIMEQTLVPNHILNAPLYQEALNVLAEIMVDEDQKGLTRVKAAEAILNGTKPPETKNIKVDLGVNQLDAISSLRDATNKLVEMQKQALSSGSMSLKDIAESDIMDAEIIEENRFEI